MKKILAVLLSAALVLSLTACSGNSETDSPRNSGSDKNSSDNSGGGQSSTPVIPSVKLGIWDVLPEIPVTDASAFSYKYNSELGGMEITDYLRESPKVRIPDSIEGEKVVSVDLSGCKKELTQLVMPDSVKGFKLSDTIYKTLQYVNVPKGVDTVGRFGSNLTAVYISDGVVKIGKDAFQECKSLTSVNIPNSVTEIGDGAFSGCTSLKKIIIPGTITTIQRYTFGGCQDLDVVMLDGVAEIDFHAFNACKGAINITIPNSVAKASGYPMDCENRVNITYKGKTYNWAKSGSSLCDIINSGESGMLIENGVLTTVSPELTNVVIPDGVNEIGGSAFKNCTSLTSVTIPDSVTSIGEGAFGSCTSLTNVTYKGKVYNSDTMDILYDDINMGETGLLIEDGVLKSVSRALTEVVIPNSVTTIGDSAFNGCTSLTSVTIPNSVTEIGSSAFCNCTSLANVTIPNSVTEIGGGAFSGCTSLSSVTIPNGVTEIGYEAFKDCTSLTSVTIPNSVTKIGDGAFSGCTSLTNLTVSKGNNGIDIYSSDFADCTSLTSVAIYGGINGIWLGDHVFANCVSLTSLTLSGDREIDIGNYGLSNCKNLTNLIINMGRYDILNLGYEPFEGCEKLTIITLNGEAYDINSLWTADSP